MEQTQIGGCLWLDGVTSCGARRMGSYDAFSSDLSMIPYPARNAAPGRELISRGANPNAQIERGFSRLAIFRFGRIAPSEGHRSLLPLPPVTFASCA